jgi:hypothetical protein
MKCVRSLKSSCERCLRTGRTCLPFDRNSQSYYPPANNSHSPSQQYQERPEPVKVRNQKNSADAPLLPSIFSTSPYSNHVSQVGMEPDAQHDVPSEANKSPQQCYSTSTSIAEGQQWWHQYVSTEDAIQFIRLYAIHCITTLT